MCVCCPSNLSMNSPAGVFPNRARPTSDRIERRSDRAERKRGEREKQSKSKHNKGGEMKEGERGLKNERLGDRVREGTERQVRC